MRLREIKGDLFSTDDNLVHCVSECLEMGKGIAVQFKSKFGQIDNLKKQKKVTGQVAYITTNDRHIFYLITKKKYFEKPTYESLYLSLVELRDLCKQLNITSLSMPKIGCGLDRLDWSLVKMHIEHIFKGTNIQINVYFI
jgi:O-acetyl-ADP-ribose deacetylase (regulator of RNase III)